MNLKDFVKETIKEITQAINEANDELNDIGTLVNPKRTHVNTPEAHSTIYGYVLDPDENENYRRPVHLINFDVAVTATEKEGAGGGIGVKIAGIGIGLKGNEEQSNSTNSRLSFKIPVSLPTGE